MKIRTSLLLAFPLFLLAGCRTVGILLAIPIGIAAIVVGGTASIFVGAEGVPEDVELHGGGTRIDERLLDVEIHDDLTFEGTLSLATTVISSAGLDDAQQASLSFDPRSQMLELVSAEVVTPDGEVHEVSPDHVFTRPSDVAQGAPGFVSKLTKSILFPQLRVGSQTRVKWRFEEKAVPVMGFNYSERPFFAIPVVESRTRITYGEDVPLRFTADLAYELVESTKGKRRVLEVTLRDYEAQSPERAMVAPRDVCPKFVVTTQESWEGIGAAFHEAMAGRAEVTPEIEALAAEIVGEKQGLEAARAIHRWVCENVSYVVVHLNQQDGWVPHPASEVLANRYGDCKDKYVLNASLLAARGIEALPVLVNLDRGFEPLALPTHRQFNHCMAYLPTYDLYSNPTDPYRDLGELEVALSGKFVVLGSPEGKTAWTPRGSADDNSYRVAHRATIGADGIVSGRSVMDFAGRPAGSVRRTLALSADPDQTADDLLHATAMGGFGELDTTDPSDLDTPLHCEGSWQSDIPIAMGPTIHFTTPTGMELVNPQLIRAFLSSEERRYPLVISALEMSWSFEVELPAGYTLDVLPEGRQKTTDAGRYESRYRVTQDGRLVVERLLRIEQDRFPADRYEALRTILLESVVDMQTILSASIET